MSEISTIFGLCVLMHVVGDTSGYTARGNYMPALTSPSVSKMQNKTG